MTGSKQVAGIGLALALASCKPAPSHEPAPEPALASVGAAVIVEAPPAAPACTAREPRGAPRLVPDAAEWVVHVSPREVLSSWLWPLIDLSNQSDWTAVDTVFTGCNVPLERVDHVLVGFDHREDFVAVIAAPGVGQPETARCVMLALQQLAGDEQAAEVTPMPDDPSLSIIQFSDGRAYLFHPDVLALATTAWETELARLGRCEGSAAIGGSLATLVTQVDTHAPLWIIGRPVGDIETALSGALSAPGGVRTVSASVRLDAGAALVARAGMSDASTASASAEAVRGLVDFALASLPPQLGPLGQRVVVEARGEALVFEAAIRTEELRVLMEQP